MGGAWERMVRSVKRAIYAIIPNGNFTDLTLKASMAEAVYMVNMRPLTQVPIGSEEEEAITPNHFLIGSSNGVKPTGEIPNDDEKLREQYLTAQQFRNRLWKRWVVEYLPDLLRRPKNLSPAVPLQEGDIVVICDNQLPANTWPKGRVIKTYPGADGQVRSAAVKTTQGIYHRPTSKLAKIDVAPNREVPSQGGEC